MHRTNFQKIHILDPFFTCVKLHEGWHKLIDRQWVVLHHLKETLSAWLHRRVGDEQHLHQLGNQVWVLYVILTADEDNQEGHNVFSGWLIESLWKVPEKERGKKSYFTKTKFRFQYYNVYI